MGARSALKIVRAKIAVRIAGANGVAMIAVIDLVAVKPVVAGVESVTRAEPARAVNPEKSVNPANSVKHPRCVRFGTCDLNVRNALNGNPVKTIVVAPVSGVNAPTVAVIAVKAVVRLAESRNLRSVLNAHRRLKSSPLRLRSRSLSLRRSKFPSRPTGIAWMTSSAGFGCARPVRLRPRPLVQRAASAEDGMIAVVMIAVGIQATAGVVAAVGTDFFSHVGPSGRVSGSTGIGTRHQWRASPSWLQCCRQSGVRGCRVGALLHAHRV